MAAMLWAVLASALPLAAQEGGIDQGLELIRPPGEQPFIRWQTKPGRTYFVQVATQAAPLQEWYFTPFIEVGEGQTIDYEVPASAEIGFFRLKYTDLPLFPGELPENANPDYDDLTSGEELLITHTDPLEWDTDGDGLSDGWEHHNGLDPIDPFGDNGADGDPDHDGLLNSEEQIAETKPKDADSDNDGITDGSEINQGADPNDPDDTPDAEWFVLTGDYPATLSKSRSRTITIPKGQCRLVAVMLASAEFPEFTDPESGYHEEYNDILTWNVAGGGLGLNGSIDVNSYHDYWVLADSGEITHLGFPAVHLEDYKSVQAPPDADLTINISASATNIGDGYYPSTVMVGLLPIEFEITHTEKERDLDGNELTTVVTPGEHVLLRDEIADLRIKVPSLDGADWNMMLDVEPAAMKTATLGARGAVQMYDFGRIENETVIPLTAGGNGTTITGPYAIALPGAEGGQDTFRIVVNNEGAFRLRLKTADDKVNVNSQEFTVNTRIRKYATLEHGGQLESNNFDAIFETSVGWWQDWEIGNANGNYTFKDSGQRYTPELLKAIAWKECDLHPASAAAHGTTELDIMQVNAGNRPGADDMTGSSALADWNERALAVDVEVLVGGSYEIKTLYTFEADPPGGVQVDDFSVRKMRYPAIGLQPIDSYCNSVRWALRKLLYKQYDLAAADFLVTYRVKGHGETLFGATKPQIRSLSETVRRYGDTQATYPLHVFRMRDEGIGTRGTGDEYRWPRLTNDKARH
jgi:hypothetical protein